MCRARVSIQSVRHAAERLSAECRVHLGKAGLPLSAAIDTAYPPQHAVPSDMTDLLQAVDAAENERALT